MRFIGGIKAEVVGRRSCRAVAVFELSDKNDKSALAQGKQQAVQV